MTISSYYKAFTSFNSEELLEISKHALLGAIPGIPMILSVASLFETIRPQTCLLNPSYPKSTFFVLDGSKEQTERIMDLYLQRRVRVQAATSHIETAVKTQLKSEMIQLNQNLMAKIRKIAADFGIEKIYTTVEIPTDEQNLETSFAAVGGSCGWGVPMIVFTPRRFNIIAKSSGTSLLNRARFLGTQDEKIREFAIAHEMVHIAKNHALIEIISSVAFSIFTTCLWMTAGFSLAGIVGTFTVVTGVSFLFNLFYATLRRDHEKEADLEAMNYLQTNEGAIGVFEVETKENPVLDLYHPTGADRLEYSRRQIFNRAAH